MQLDTKKMFKIYEQIYISLIRFFQVRYTECIEEVLNWEIFAESREISHLHIINILFPRGGIQFPNLTFNFFSLQFPCKL